MFAKFGVHSSSHFPVRVQTASQKKSQMLPAWAVNIILIVDVKQHKQYQQQTNKRINENKCNTRSVPKVSGLVYK